MKKTETQSKAKIKPISIKARVKVRAGDWLNNANESLKTRIKVYPMDWLNNASETLL